MTRERALFISICCADAIRMTSESWCRHRQTIHGLSPSYYPALKYQHISPTARYRSKPQYRMLLRGIFQTGGNQRRGYVQFRPTSIGRISRPV